MYWRNRWDEPSYSQFRPPVCHPFTPGNIDQIPGFSPPEGYIHLINTMAQESRLNPHYLAGLIAQESGFDPKAVSWAKAIGLTQITPIAEEEIIRLKGGKIAWPRYSGINDLSFGSLKALIMSGKINSSSEWRLNPRHSIAGGIDYIDYLTKFWGSNSNRQTLDLLPGDSKTNFSRVLLASYNSGASRVGSAIKKSGDDWLKQNNLQEARKYVNRIFSYCYHFAEKENGNADET